jgi:class 3 adenylate cyclase
MTETRKLAAILVADVVGYSRLTGADEDRTLARLRNFRVAPSVFARAVVERVTTLCRVRVRALRAR